MNGMRSRRRFLAGAGLFAVAGSALAAEPASLLHAGEHGVERACAHLVSMAPQLPQHPLADDRLGRGVVKDVNLPEGQEELAFDVSHGNSGEPSPGRRSDNRSRLP